MPLIAQVQPNSWNDEMSAFCRTIVVMAERIPTNPSP
jgi:hypothetical protein